MKWAPGGANYRINAAAIIALAVLLVGGFAAAVTFVGIHNKGSGCTADPIYQTSCPPAHHDYTWFYIVLGVTSALFSLLITYALVADAVRVGIRAAAEDRAQDAEKVKS